MTGKFLRNCQYFVFASSLLASLSAHPQTLQDALRFAISNDPDVKAQISRRLQSDETVKQARAGFLPVVDLTAGVGYENSDNPTSAAIFNDNDATLRRNESALNVNQNLFQGFNTINEMRRTKATVVSSAFKVSSTSQDLAVDVAEKYLNVLREQEIVSLAERNLQSHLRIFKMIKIRSASGVGKMADLAQAKGRLARADANLISERANLGDAQTNYLRTVGIMPNSLNKPPVPGSRWIPNSLPQALEFALENHPSLKTAQADVFAARFEHKATLSRNYPKIDIQLEGSRNSNLDGQPGVNNDEMAMLRGSYNLFNGGADIAKQRETAYRVTEAAEIRNRAIRQLVENLRLSWMLLLSTRSQLEDLKQHRDATLATVIAYREQFQLGQRTLLDLLNSENEYYQASVNYVSATYSELLARYRILNSMGTFLSFMNVALPKEANVKSNNIPMPRIIDSENLPAAQPQM